MHDSAGVCRMHGVGNLQDDGGNFVTGQWSIALGITLENLTGGPFDYEVVQPLSRLARFNRPHHIRVLDAGTKTGFANKSRDSSLVLT